MSAFFGKKATVAPLEKLDLGTEQAKALAANKANMPAAEALASEANTFSREQITKMLESAMPGFDKMRDTTTANIQSELSGEIPKDVQDAIQNSTAARALGTGTGGSGMARNLLARDLGLTSLDLTSRGISSAQKWISEAASIYEPGMTSATAMFISPGQQYAADNEQNVQQFQRQMGKNLISAAPDPVAQGVMNMSMEMMKSLRGGGGGGGGMSGGGGGGGWDTGMSMGTDSMSGGFMGTN